MSASLRHVLDLEIKHHSKSETPVTNRKKLRLKKKDFSKITSVSLPPVRLCLLLSIFSNLTVSLIFFLTKSARINSSGPRSDSGFLSIFELSCEKEEDEKKRGRLGAEI
jgi:hypothetical protein